MKPIRDILSLRPLVKLKRTATAFDAANIMHAEKVGCVLVTEADQQPCGIFTERDLMSRIVVPGRDPATTKLEEVMTSEVFVVQGDRPVNQVRREMSERHIRHVPVMDGERVLSMLSLRDILRADIAAQREAIHEMQEYIRNPI